MKKYSFLWYLKKFVECKSTNQAEEIIIIENNVKFYVARQIRDKKYYFEYNLYLAIDNHIEKIQF